MADSPRSRKYERAAIQNPGTLATNLLTDNCQPGFSKLQVSFVMVLNTITDLYLMAIPLPVSPHLAPCRATMLKPRLPGYLQVSAEHEQKDLPDRAL